LWSKYYFEIYFGSKPDTGGILPRILSELKTALKIDPNNQQAREMLMWISSLIPGSVQIDGDNYTFLGLTATPLPPTPYVVEVSATPTSIPTETTVPTISVTETTAPPVPTPIPTANNPLCGSAFLLPALAIGIWTSHRKRT
jgi:hypothetical protein